MRRTFLVTYSLSQPLLCTPNERLVRQGKKMLTNVCKKGNSQGMDPKQLTDASLKERLAVKVKRMGVREDEIRDVPKGKGVFEFCVVKGKTRPLMVFVDSGCDGWATGDKAIPELTAVRLEDGPIRLNVASDKTVLATGEWGALIPLNGGTYQTVRGLSLPSVP